jgi:broad specificity phosphatase PhoE
LATKLVAWKPDVVITSLEPKAIETGRLAAGFLGIPCETATGLHEQERTSAKFTSQERFQSDIAAFFQRPDELVFGDETANQAVQRFRHAVTTVLARHSQGNVCIVAHGTVITLFVAQATDIDPFAFWQRLGLPAYIVFSLPEMGLLTVEDCIC